uniref:Uncharacterized protein n=1 Tax=Anguilla anguilla TaxID=7936 RepID=A0A0E9SWI7_ANGAN
MVAYGVIYFLNRKTSAIIFVLLTECNYLFCKKTFV